MLDAHGVEHAIKTMQHRYVQCSQPGCAGLRNYRRRELQLLLGASDDKESRSSASERGQEDPLSEDISMHLIRVKRSVWWSLRRRWPRRSQVKIALMRRDNAGTGQVRTGAVSVLGGAPWRLLGLETVTMKRTWKETLGWDDGLSLPALI